MRVSTLKGLNIPAQGVALGWKVYRLALKGRDMTLSFVCHAPSGLNLGDRAPRALPWAGMSRPFGAKDRHGTRDETGN